MKKLIIILSFAMFCVTLSAQNEENIAYKNGEKIELAISYRAKMWPNTDMGKVTFTVSEEILYAQPTYRIEASARTTIFRWFFKMDDFYATWINRNTMLPVRTTSELSEGSYRFSSDQTYDWTNMVANSRWRNHKRPNETTKSIALTEKSKDAIAIFYELRSSDIRSMIPGEPLELELLLEDTIRKIQYKYLGPEVIDMGKSLGKIKALKFSCQLATSEGERFEDGDEFFIWVSDDRNKVPVLFESPIRIGSVRARLVSYKNLKFPDDGVLQ